MKVFHDISACPPASLPKNPMDIKAILTVLVEVGDVSRSFLWLNGRHQAIHTAGDDLTGNLDEAPHDADVMSRFPMVGTLEAE
jgi:predicted heme/steroid binding protein